MEKGVLSSMGKWAALMAAHLLSSSGKEKASQGNFEMGQLLTSILF